MYAEDWKYIPVPDLVYVHMQSVPPWKGSMYLPSHLSFHSFVNLTIRSEFSFMQYLAASRGVWTCSELNLGSPKYIFTRRKYCRVLTSYRSIFVFLVQWICLWTINCGFCKTSDGLKFGMQSFTIGGASGPVFRSCWASYLRCSSIGFITSQSIGRR